ncbi:mRNA-capping enzyme subunit beta [Geranomyces variabilis]|uniref:mRNA-capping enzyme subunit beta n=1 Tax=Geranomyces variabilis TaxID=109894 RepID=A0AAD5TBZ4_9FUNG|nr:mRNA-capping enzyme subunit beta [Geranomyces variabilis]
MNNIDSDQPSRKRPRLEGASEDDDGGRESGDKNGVANGHSREESADAVAEDEASVTASREPSVTHEEDCSSEPQSTHKSAESQQQPALTSQPTQSIANAAVSQPLAKTGVMPAPVTAAAPLSSSRPPPPPPQPQPQPQPSASAPQQQRSNHHHHQQPHSMHHLQPSIFGKRPDDDIVLQVSEFFWQNLGAVADGRQLEIEGKLGLIVDRNTGNRIRLPVRSETVLWNDGSYRFDSNMTRDQHGHFNRVLNALVQPPAPGITPLRYIHTNEVDHYHEGGGGDGGRNKIRVSMDQKTGQVREVLCKRRIADLEIHLPNSPLDFRISMSLEMPAPHPPPGSVSRSRRFKDRLSYSHQAVRVDLTQVKQVMGKSEEVTHECEVEFIRAACLLEEREKRLRNQPNLFTAYVDVFLNNLRFLSRKAPRLP